MTAIPEGLVVLIADDDCNDIVLIRRAFKRLTGVGQLIEVRDGDETIAYLEGNGRYADRARWPLPRLLVLDQWMPRLSGFEVLSWLRSNPRFASLPVVILTGCLPPVQAEMMARMKAAYCVKSVESKKMLETLRASLATALRLVWQSSAPASTWFTLQQPDHMTLNQRPEPAQIRP